jgi:hypothetical protein
MPQYQPSYGTHVYTVEETLEAISAPPMGGVARHHQNVPSPRDDVPSLPVWITEKPCESNGAYAQEIIAL